MFKSGKILIFFLGLFRVCLFWQRKTKTRLTVDSPSSRFSATDDATERPAKEDDFDGFRKRERKRDGRDPLCARVEICRCFFESSSMT